MKTAIKKSLVLVALIVAVTVSYGNEISGNKNDGKGVTTNVTFNNVEKGSILSIKDMNGLVLYKEAIKKSGNYSKGFDLTTLPNGDYYFELNKDIEIEIIPFNVVSSNVTFDKAAKTRIFKPVVWLNKRKVFVSKMALPEETLEIQIYAESSEKILAEKIEMKDGILGRIYDFSTSEKGIYTFITKTNGRRFVNYIEIL